MLRDLEATATKTAKKTVASPISKKTLCTCSTLFCTFLCRCFARQQRETSRNFRVTRFMEEMLYVVLFTFFFRCRSFLPWCPPAFLIFSPPLQYFHVILHTKLVSSFSVIHANADIKIKSKERIGFVVACCCFLSLKVRMSLRCTA